jgi:DNA topoisomerase IB
MRSLPLPLPAESDSQSQEFPLRFPILHWYWLPTFLATNCFSITQAIKQAAKQLGNRPATCRKYYVHPAIIDAYLDGSLLSTMEQQEELDTEDAPHSLSPQERGMLAVLEQQLVQHKE